MAMLKRVFLFAAVNILVVLTLSISAHIVMGFLGIDPSEFSGLFVLYGMIGMGGAFVSLFMSKWMAKSAMGVKLIDPRTSDPFQRQLVERVHQMAKQAGLPKMPEVGIYESADVNAFATGPSRSNSLVAVSTGLLHRMNQDEVDGVLAHEVAHIANGDMVTMTLIQGIINTVVLVLARLIANLISSAVDERMRFAVQFGAFMALQILLGILGSLVVNAFSRHREYRADAGGARLAGRDKMIAALKALSRQMPQPLAEEQKAFASMKISGSRAAKLFSTHPPLEDRIRALESSTRF